MSQGPSDSADLGVLADLAPELASTFVTVASDIALVIGQDGVVRNVAQGESPLMRQAFQWVGRPFIDAFTQDTRGKILQLLLDVGAHGVSRRREVNLQGLEGHDIPMSFAAVRLGRDGPVLAVGRDLRAIAAIQQRFVEAQQEMERDYWRRRQAESRYRLLFQVATDAVMVVEAESFAIVEANAAAAEVFCRPAEALVGQPATIGVDIGSRPAVEQLLLTARSTGKPAEIRARLGVRVESSLPVLVDIAATPFMAQAGDHAQLLLMVRVRRSDVAGSDSVRRLADYVEHTPDAVAITDSSGRLLMSNPAFLLLCPTGVAESQLRGQKLGDVVGDPGRRLERLVVEVRQQGIASQVRAVLGQVGGGPGFEVDISAALLNEGDQECIGLTLRRRAALPDVTKVPAVEGLSAALEALVSQLGHLPLPDLLHEASQMAERHLIRHALARSGGDTQATAQWLGIPPETLAPRLQRLGLSASHGRSGPATLLN